MPVHRFREATVYKQFSHLLCSLMAHDHRRTSQNCAHDFPAPCPMCLVLYWTIVETVDSLGVSPFRVVDLALQLISHFEGISLSVSTTLYLGVFVIIYTSTYHGLLHRRNSANPYLLPILSLPSHNRLLLARLGVRSVLDENHNCG